MSHNDCLKTVPKADLKFGRHGICPRWRQRIKDLFKTKRRQMEKQIEAEEQFDRDEEAWERDS